jgi:hypothetical protein
MRIMKLTLISTLSCALLVAALPQDTWKHYREKCSNNQLSCCSDLKNTAEANGNTISTNIQGGDLTAVLGEDLSNTISLVTDIIPISILSGCAPILGLGAYKLGQSVNYFRDRFLTKFSR